MEMAETINAEAANALGDGETPMKSKKPSNSAFKQQRLSAWQPILTAGTVLPTFFVIGILFIPVGIGLWYFSDNVREVVIHYTDCDSVENPSQKCKDVIGAKPGGEPGVNCSCLMNFPLEEALKGKVYMYYALTNFYQNHRRYVKSRDDVQLFGGTDDPSYECKPFRKEDEAKDSGRIVWPCGAIANSMFQDVINLYQRQPDGSDKLVPLENTGIAWESDKQFKFKNPDLFYKNLDEFKKKFMKPTAWARAPWDLDPDNPDNNGVQNEDFIVWMRTAALPNFRKLYRIVNQTAGGGFRDGMPKGNYSVYINYTYPVTSFQGTKSIVFSTTSLLGGKNPFLGIAYIVMGCVCLLLGIVFLFVHINYGKSTWEMTNVDVRTTF